MKKLILILSVFVLLGSVKAQDTTLTPFTPDGYTMQLHIEYIASKVDNQALNVIKKYHGKGYKYEKYITAETIRLYGMERAIALNNDADPDTMLCAAFGILKTQIRKHEQQRFLQLMYATAESENIGDSVMAWSDKNGLNVGIYDANCQDDNYVWLRKNDGTGIQVIKKSLTIATSEDIKNYY